MSGRSHRSPATTSALSPSPPSVSSPECEWPPWDPRYGNAAAQDALRDQDPREPRLRRTDPDQGVAIEYALEGARSLATHALEALALRHESREHQRFVEHFHTDDDEVAEIVEAKLLAVRAGLHGAVPITAQAPPYHIALWGKDKDILAFVTAVRFTDIRFDIHVMPVFFTKAPAQQADILFHEACHKYGLVDDQAYRFQAAFASLTTTQALDNADSFTAYAASRKDDVEQDAADEEARARAWAQMYAPLLWDDYQAGRLRLFDDGATLPDGRFVAAEAAGYGVVDWLVAERSDVVSFVTEYAHSEPLLLPSGEVVGPELFFHLMWVSGRQAP